MKMDEFSDLTPNQFLIVLGKMNAAIQNKLEKHLKDLGFNTTEFLIMYSIAVHGPLTIQDIAARISVTSGNMTYTIDKLEKRGLLQRIRCPEDRRKIFIDFTAEGKDIWEKSIDLHAVFLNERFVNVDQDMIKQTIEFMKIIGKSF